MFDNFHDIRNYISTSMFIIEDLKSSLSNVDKLNKNFNSKTFDIKNKKSNSEMKFRNTKKKYNFDSIQK